MSLPPAKQFALPCIKKPDDCVKFKITLPNDILNSISIDKKIKVLAATSLTSRMPGCSSMKPFQNDYHTVSRDISHMKSRHKQRKSKIVLNMEGSDQ